MLQKLFYVVVVICTFSYISGYCNYRLSVRQGSNYSGPLEILLLLVYFSLIIASVCYMTGDYISMSAKKPSEVLFGSLVMCYHIFIVAPCSFFIHSIHGDRFEREAEAVIDARAADM